MHLADATFFTDLSGLLQGLSELFLAIGAGVGFLINSRRNAKRQRVRAEEAAALAAKQTKETLESRLEIERESKENQYEQQIENLKIQNASLSAQLADEKNDNKVLLRKVLKEEN